MSAREEAIDDVSTAVLRVEKQTLDLIASEANRLRVAGFPPEVIEAFYLTTAGAVAGALVGRAVSGDQVHAHMAIVLRMPPLIKQIIELAHIERSRPRPEEYRQ